MKKTQILENYSSQKRLVIDIKYIRFFFIKKKLY